MTEAELVRLVDGLEEAAEGYLTLDDVIAAAGEDVAAAVVSGLLLVDYRTRLDGSPATVCRLNRHHPEVVRLSVW